MPLGEKLKKNQKNAREGDNKDDINNARPEHRILWL